MKKISLILISILTILFVANLVVLDINWFKSKRIENLSSGEMIKPSTSDITPTLLDTPVSGTCSSDCSDLIDQKISQAIATISGKETIKETKVVEKTTTSTSQPQVIYIPLGGGGSTTSKEWADVGNAEVYFEIGDYPNVDRIYFEGFINVKHGNGKAFARLYDVTHGIGVQGSDIYTDSESFTLVESGSLSFWQGKNLYRIQIKSLNGYEASIDSGRIKIILK